MARAADVMAAGTLFCFGFGLSARMLAETLAGEGWRVIGTMRSIDKAAAIAAAGAETVIFTGDAPMDDAGRRALAAADHVLLSVPPGDGGDPVLAHHGRDIAASPAIRWLGYLSTTGVYGDRGGGWVDETTPPAPTTERGDRRLRAECGWLDLGATAGLAVHVFRLAGIYGPGRNAIGTVRSGRARRIVKPGQVFSRIHAADIARVLRASIARPNPGRIYNVCDGEAAPPQDVIAFAAGLLGVDPPPEIPFEAADLSPMAASFYRDNKRVRADRIKTELGVDLAYPTYRDGLRALVSRGE